MSYLTFTIGSYWKLLDHFARSYLAAFSKKMPWGKTQGTWQTYTAPG